MSNTILKLLNINVKLLIIRVQKKAGIKETLKI